MLVSGVVNAPGADPSYYLKKSTWQETILASEAALAQQQLEDGFASFESDILRGSDPPHRLTVSVTGAREMYLFVAGIPDVKWGVADWAEARLMAADGKATSLSEAPGAFKVLEGRVETNMTLRSGLYQRMRMQGQTFERGLNVQAYSVLRVPLEGQYDRFEAWIGVDDWAGTNGSVRFSVVGAKTAARKRLWELVLRDFPNGPSRQEIRWELEDHIFEPDWLTQGLQVLAQRYATASRRIPPLAAQAGKLAPEVNEANGLAAIRTLYYRSRAWDQALTAARGFDYTGLRLALADLVTSFGDRYPKGPGYLTRLASLEHNLRSALATLPSTRLEDYQQAVQLEADLEALKSEALLANPLLDFERLLVINRRPIGDPRRSQWEDRGLGEYLGLPKQSSWHLSTIPRTDNWDNELAVLSPVRPSGQFTTLFKPDKTRLLTDVDLHFDAQKLMFSMPDDNHRWQIYEINAQGQRQRQLTPGDQPEVHCYDSCYLPNGQIAFLSTAPLQGVPCNAAVNVGMMYLMDSQGGNIHQVCFEQDHDYCPTVLNDGRVMYLRWDYTDTPHVWNRLLMSMNPDGTGQMEYYGSGSYWPNAIFFARPIPNHPTQVVGIVTGHHEGRIGELVVFDPARGRHEVEGVVQRIPGRGRPVEPKIEDKLTEHSWPKFLHPFPLSEKYFLVAGKPEPDSLWGIYLVDLFDNRVLVREEENRALLEPIPFRRTARPPVIPDKVQPDLSNAVVFLQDIYRGPGLKDVPRGTIKSLRLFTYHFGYQQVAGIDHRVGADGPWEIKRVLGTVPVEADGSALFRIPAKYPISLQPLDAEGKAVALMRSWLTAMPGEIVSCIGCHERQGTAPPVVNAQALQRPPTDITPWHGPTRGFSFAREVQPVLDRYCVSCHNGAPGQDGQALADLRGDQDAFVVYEHGQPLGKKIRGIPKKELLGKYSAVFEPAYVELRQYVRVGGLESDLHVLPPGEFHADTSELIQMLKKGHHGVKLEAEAWDRLITWIDLNAPCHGTWAEVTRIPGHQQPERRRLLRQLYGGIVENDEEIPAVARDPLQSIKPEIAPSQPVAPVEIAGWPFDAAQAHQRQAAAGPVTRTVNLGGGVTLELVRIPAGNFVMGDASGEADEMPLIAVTVEKPFWMSKYEITHQQYRRFRPQHDSRFEDRSSWIFSEEYLGWTLNRDRQPVVRVSCLEAMEFCRWLTRQIGEPVALPTEIEWEYACRAGTATPLSYGGTDQDFSRFANLADATLKNLALDGWRPRSPDLVPRVARFDDHALVTTEVGQYQPNAWGLYDLHGNAAEWTRTTYRPDPSLTAKGERRLASAAESATQLSDAVSTHPATELKVVRGGSWRDRPHRSRSAFRLSYPAWQKVYNVGFRVVITEN